jgi:hypothetical protein
MRLLTVTERMTLHHGASEGKPYAEALCWRETLRRLLWLRYTSAQDVPPAKAGSFVGDPVGLLPTTTALTVLISTPRVPL